MEREMLGHMFRYEDGMLFKKHKQCNKWICYNDNKPNSNGYIAVMVNNKLYMLHRLVYKFHNDEWDIEFSHNNSIDHINGNPSDNRIENLRVVTHSENLQNITHMNGKLITGAYCTKDGRKKPWRTQWAQNGKLKSKSFATEKEAIDYRAEMVKIHYTHDPLKRPS